MDNDTLNNLSSLDIVFLTVFGESRGEVIEGQVGVACVIRNRFLTGKFKSYRDICLQAEQFSCWNVNDPNRPVLLEMAQKLINGQLINEQPFERQCRLISDGVINHNIIDNTSGATNYLTESLWLNSSRPSWAKNVKTAKQLGHQVFFKV